VVDIYGYCSAAGLFEYSNGGDITNAIWPRNETMAPTPLRKLQIATQGAMALAAVHNVDREGQATIAHTDIGPDQFILIGGRYKLNDFNRARFLLKFKGNGTNCPYFVNKNPGKNRSPEEYSYKPQTEKVRLFENRLVKRDIAFVFSTLTSRVFPFSLPPPRWTYTPLGTSYIRCCRRSCPFKTLEARASPIWS
jgi:hypothetical protein